jgi:hypothetical protein
MLLIGFIVFISVQIKGNEMGWECGMYGGKKSAYRVVVGNWK